MHLALMLALTSAPAEAAFVKQPYLQYARQDGVCVSLQLDAAEACQVDYGTTTALGSTVTSPSDTFHEIEVEGLTVSNVYFYEVSCGSNVSATSTFATSPHTDEAFSFVVVGDTRTDIEEHQAVVDQVISSVGYADLYFNTGDLVEHGDDGDQWSDFFDIESTLMAGMPLYPVAGNHDDVEEESYYTQFFHLPDATSGTENWYAFQHGNSLFVVVDTNEDYVTGSEQYDWLEATLQDAVDNPEIRHIFAFWHDPPYTSGAHGVFDYEDWYPARTYLAPLMATYGVDVVFNGHDHHYERSYTAVTDDVTYIVTGGGGAPGAPGDFVEGIDGIVKWLGMEPGETVGEFLEDNSWVLSLLQGFGYAEDYEEGWWRAEAEVMKHFVLVEVQGSYVHASVITKDGDLFEEWDLGTYDPDIVDDDADGYTEDQDDCDDSDASIHPGAEDDCDGVDNDCDGVDNGCDTGGGSDGGGSGGGTGGGDGGAQADDTGAPDGEPAEDVEGGDKDKGCGCASAPAPGWLVLLLPGLAALRRRRS